MKEVFVACKKNGKLLFKNIHEIQTRNISTMKCMYEADKIYNWGDFVITIRTSDTCANHEYGYAKNTLYRLIPDFNFWGWPEVGINNYSVTVNEIMMAGEEPFLSNKIGWIGNLNTSIIRKKLFNFSKKYPTMMDIISMKWSQSTLLKLNATQYLSMTDLVKKYAFLIDVEGYGYSGRLKYLLWSQRPILVVDRPYKEYFFENLKEWEHYIPVKRDLTDLHEKMMWCFTNTEKANEIAQNALTFSKKHLTREACYAKWNDVIQTLSK
uniref:Glycosyl transferase CAP10 domain-containing protein n=1 Tax=viral metagenome TaxID=1070528 RepID=A0A6C0HS80_9ZZZZ